MLNLGNAGNPAGVLFAPFSAKRRQTPIPSIGDSSFSREASAGAGLAAFGAVSPECARALPGRSDEWRHCRLDSTRSRRRPRPPRAAAARGIPTPRPGRRAAIPSSVESSSRWVIGAVDLRVAIDATPIQNPLIGNGAAREIATRQEIVGMTEPCPLRVTTVAQKGRWALE